ncbi:MAG: Npt1/Npt2 family nucleotide transporter [Myxococcales bacterium]|nr:Npt1/Npt2 family nucleotide transporter [Myxococcales bacterium]
MSGLTQRLLGLRRDEVRRVWPLALAYGLVMAALYVLKPVRNALFLDRFGVEDLPYVLLLVAVLGALTAALYARVASDMRLDRLLLSVFGIFVVSLVGFRAILPSTSAPVIFLFYVWVALYGLVATSLLWQLANAQFNAREARRLFGLIGVGGIAGAVFGGLFTGWAATALGTENLVLVAAGFLVLSWLSMRAGEAASGLKAPEHTRSQGVGQDLKESELLRSIVVSAALVATVAVIADVQFNDVVERSYPDKDDKTAFFGAFFASLNVMAIVIQLVVTPRILTHFGVGVGLLVLPLSLGLGTVGLLLVPGLLTGILPKLADGGLRHSVHKAASEILFIPIPAAVTKRSKLFVDATVDSFFTGVGALLVLFLTTQLGVSHRSLGLLTLPLVGFWLGYVMRVRQAYVGAFRDALARRELDVGELRVNISEASTVDALIRALDSQNIRQLQYALDMLVPVEDERLLARVPELLEHADGSVRARALRVLSGQRTGDPALGERMLADPDHRVRVEAVHHLSVHGESDPRARLEEMLRGGDTALRAAVLGSIAQYGAQEEYALLDRELVEGLITLEGQEGELVRVHVAKALEGARGDQLESLWPRLQDDTSEAVVRQAIESAGISRGEGRLPWLLSLLDDKRYRMDARLALAGYGASIIDELDRRLGDPECSDRVRRTLPRILARIDSQRSVEVLLDHVHGADEVLLRALVGALAKLKKRFPHLSFEDPRIDALLETMIDRYQLHVRVSRALGSASGGVGARLLLRSLEDKRVEELRWIFMLLGLRYGHDDMGRVQHGLGSGDRSLRASALEFLDNVLQHDQEKRLLGLLEGEHTLAEQEAPSDRSERGLRDEREGALRELLEGDDAWLRAAALYATREGGATMARDWAERAKADSDGLVRETAEVVLGALESLDERASAE